MSEYYNPTRSKIELFRECPGGLYLDRRLGVGPPPRVPFSLNSAVDTLLKKEFDIHRAGSTVHPLMKAYGIDAVPFRHMMMDEWRENFKGMQYLYVPTNFLVTGAVDDIWQNPKGELHIVDYKSTSKQSEVNIDADWQGGYKRQMEIYQWLFRQHEYPVSRIGYFVYCNGITDKQAFDGKLEFDVKIIPYEGDDAWVGGVLQDIKK